MYLKAYGKSIFRSAGGVCAATIAALLIMYSENGRNGAANGIEISLKILAPSLFPFMTAVNLMINTGFCVAAGKALEKPSRLLFGLGGSFATVFLLSMVGGYPVGAAGISKLYSSGELSENEAKRASLFCVGAGPGFLISYVGVWLYSNRMIGAYLLISQIISAVLLGIAARFLYRNEIDISKKEIKQASLPFSQAMTEAVYSASRSMAAIAGFVIVFSTFLSVCEGIVQSKTAMQGIRLTLEVCSAAGLLSGVMPLDAIAFAAGFGGICVHFQIFSALGKVKVSKVLFFVFRIIQGLFTALFTHILMFMIPVPVQVFSTQSRAFGEVFGGNLLSGAMLVAVAICFLISVKNIKKV